MLNLRRLCVVCHLVVTCTSNSRYHRFQSRIGRGRKHHSKPQHLNFKTSGDSMTPSEVCGGGGLLLGNGGFRETLV